MGYKFTPLESVSFFLSSAFAVIYQAERCLSDCTINRLRVSAEAVAALVRARPRAPLSAAGCCGRSLPNCSDIVYAWVIVCSVVYFRCFPTQDAKSSNFPLSGSEHLPARRSGKLPGMLV